MVHHRINGLFLPGFAPLTIEVMVGVSYVASASNGPLITHPGNMLLSTFRATALPDPLSICSAQQAAPGFSPSVK